jgi:hypothetical protein
VIPCDWGRLRRPRARGFASRPKESKWVIKKDKEFILELIKISHKIYELINDKLILNPITHK